MPIDTYQINRLKSDDRHEVMITKMNELIIVVNGLPSTSIGALTRAGGTIDGLSSGDADSGESGSLFIVEDGGLGLGAFLDTGEETTVTGLLQIIQTTGHANAYVEAGATVGETTGTANSGHVWVRDVGLANNYVKLAVLPDVQGVAGPTSGRESLVPIIIHTQMGNSGSDKSYQEMLRIERQSDTDIAAAASSAAYISFRSMDNDSGGTYDHVRIVGKADGPTETNGVFEIWCASSGVATKQLWTGNASTHIVATTDSTVSTDGALVVDGGMGVLKKMYVGANLTFENTDDAAHSLDGVVEVAGGVGVAKQLWTGANTTVGQDARVTTNVRSSGTADAAHSLDGAFETAGGMAIAKKLNVGTTLSVDALAITGSTPLLNVVHSPRGWISGFVISCGNTHINTGNALSITAGECRDTVNGNTCVFPTGMTKQVNTAFSLGDAGGALPSGVTYPAATVQTFFGVFVIRAPDGTVDVGIDELGSAPTNLISAAITIDSATWTGATYRQVQIIGLEHGFEEEADGRIREFTCSVQDPEYIRWNHQGGKQQEPGWLSTGLTFTANNTPPNVRWRGAVHYRAAAGGDENQYLNIYPTGYGLIKPGTTYYHSFQSQESTNAGDKRDVLVLDIDVDGSSEWEYTSDVSDSDFSLQIHTHGFRYSRGAND